MMTSTIKNKAIYSLIWLSIWQILSVIVDSDIILVSPIKVLIRLFELLAIKTTYISTFNSIISIFSGFLLAFLIGILLAIFSSKYKMVYNFFILPINVIRVTPVASFVIMALFWVKSDYLSTLIVFLITLPVFFLNTYEGLKTVDKHLLEMAKIYHISLLNKVKFIYLACLKPFLASSISIGISLAFKSGVAGEVIALSSGTIGGNLQRAKVILEFADVFCYTIIIIIVSVIIEKLVLKAVKYAFEVINND